MDMDVEEDVLSLGKQKKVIDNNGHFVYVSSTENDTNKSNNNDTIDNITALPVVDLVIDKDVNVAVVNEIKGNPIEKANGGIGIIPFVYKDALNYYYMIYLAQINNDTVKHEQKVREITIESPEVYVRPPKMFNVGEDE